MQRPTSAAASAASVSATACESLFHSPSPCDVQVRKKGVGCRLAKGFAIKDSHWDSALVCILDQIEARQRPELRPVVRTAWARLFGAVVDEMRNAYAAHRRHDAAPDSPTAQSIC